MIAKGTFSIRVTPMELKDKANEESSVQHMHFEKTFTGELSGKSMGTMLTTMTNIKGSAGYVAQERVQAQLSGKTGSFVLQHYGMMNRGMEKLILEIIPDSGTEWFTGISGEMHITMQNARHHYELIYSISEKQVDRDKSKGL